jgi:hypothetical protein
MTDAFFGGRIVNKHNFIEDQDPRVLLRGLVLNLHFDWDENDIILFLGSVIKLLFFLCTSS